MPSTFPLKITLVVPEIRVADVDFNLAQMLKALPLASASKNQLIIFPELALTGKTCGDLFLQPTLTEAVNQAMDTLFAACHDHKVWVLAGVPLQSQKGIFNAAALVSPNGLKAFILEKHPLARQFCSAESLKSTFVEYHGKKIPIGADLSFNFPELTERKIQVVVGDLGQSALSESAQLLLHLHTRPMLAEIQTQSPWHTLFLNKKEDMVLATCSGGPCESTTDWVASGQAQIIVNHQPVAETLPLQFTTQTCEYSPEKSKKYSWQAWQKPEDTTSASQTPFIRLAEPERQYHQVLEIQAAGLASRLRHIGLKRVVFGNSGGADSSMTLLVCVRAFEKLGFARDQILAVSMPGPGSSVDSQSRSTALAKAAGVTIQVVPIGDAVAHHLTDIAHPSGQHDTTFENAQARERTQILMDLANQQHALMVGTGDLSEIALGWSTFNGDHMSMYNVNGGLPKTLLLKVLSWAGEALLGKEGALAANNVANATISPELVPIDSDHPVQSTETIIGPYLLHDFFLWHGIGEKERPLDVYHLACAVFKDQYQPVEILKFLKTFYRRFFLNQFKRNVSADGPQVLPISLSPRGAFEMPSDACSALWLDELETLHE